MKNNSGSTIPLHKWIRHSFIITVVHLFILIQFVFSIIGMSIDIWHQKEMTEYSKTQVDTELSQLADVESQVIEKQIDEIKYLTEVYRDQVAKALLTPAEFTDEDFLRLAYTRDGVYYTAKNKEDGGAAVFYSGHFPVGDAQRSKVAQVLTLQDLMKGIRRIHPLVASVYFNTYDSLNVICPYFNVLSQYEPLLDITKYNFYYEADEAHNPERTVKWTDVYLDPAGYGWMTSAIAPVYNDGFLEGVVGIDVTVSTITSQILKMEIPWQGYGILVGKDGTILALPSQGESDFGLNELTDYHYNQAIHSDTFKPEQFNLHKMENLSSFANEVTTKVSGFTSVILQNKNQVVSWDTVSGTDWKLLLIVPESSIYQKANELSKSLLQMESIMVTAIILFSILIFYLLTKRANKMSIDIARPLVEMDHMVQKIGSGAYIQEDPHFFVSELQHTARNIIDMGKLLEESNRNLLDIQDKLKEKEADLRAIVNSLDDVILEVDRDGFIRNVWTRDGNGAPY